ncbi:hypothetical protein BKA62DRAFT_680780 [Auriculariales sp. MPI-PUGE-AT-0066]|nr:hypothetical protein BKA62DRAFT_680780 [Auriculariales sp. MPI-PUGE-AT-0066]
MPGSLFNRARSRSRPRTAGPGVPTLNITPSISEPFTSSLFLPLNNDFSLSRSDLLQIPRGDPSLAMAVDDEHRSYLEIVAPRLAVFRGVGQDVEPISLSGMVVLHLAEAMDVRDITLELAGKAKVPAASTGYNLKSQHSQTFHTFDMSFMHAGIKHHGHTFKAGRHTFPFSIELEPRLPSSMTVTHSTTSIYYRLRATAVRSALHSNLTARAPVDIVRTFGPNALEYQQTLEVENTWPGKIMYSFTLPHKAWAAGDTIMALVKFASLTKGVWVPHIATTVTETVKYGGIHGIEMKKDVSTIRHRFPRPPSASNSGGEDANLRTLPVADTIDASDSEDEIVAKIELRIPPYICPSVHTVNGPVSVSHRVRWVVIIQNPDGHFSELRCSLPLHILSRHILEESMISSAPTRRLLFGIDDLVLPEAEQLELPSYSSHVQDRIPANVDVWGALDVGPLTGTSTPGNMPANTYFPPTSAGTSASAESSGPSTPARTPFGSLEEPSPLSSAAPLSSRSYSLGALASASLSSTAITLPSQSGLFHTNGSSFFHPGGSSSRPSSRPGTRPSSPVSAPSSSHVNGHNRHDSHESTTQHHHRKPLFSLGSIKPLTPFGSRPSSRAPSRAPSRPASPPPPLPGHGSAPAAGSQNASPPASFDNALQAALSAVPDYRTASRGFAGGGVTPLSSNTGLPSYAEASQSRSERDLLSEARKLATRRKNTDTAAREEGCPGPSRSRSQAENESHSGDGSGSSSPDAHLSPRSLSDHSDEPES